MTESPQDSLPDPVLAQTLGQIKRFVSRGVKDRRSSARTPTLGTVDADGAPSQRTVVLRACAWRCPPEFLFHTDRRSTKIADIAASPAMSLHIYDAKSRTQLRFAGRGFIENADAVRRAQWQGQNEHAQRLYRSLPAPGVPMERPEALGFAEDPEQGWGNFTVLRMEVRLIDYLCLAREGHRRAQFRFGEETVDAGWVAP